MKARIINYFFTNRFCFYSNFTIKLNFLFRFYKIAFQVEGIRLINLEFSNYQLIKSYKNFAKYIPDVHLRKLGPLVLLSIPTLHKLKDVKRVSEVYSEIFQNSTRIGLDFYLEQQGRKFINDWQKSRVSDHFKNLKELQVAVGFIHGDMHRNNIMVDNAGHLKFIDLDFCEKSEFVVFDLINIFFSDKIWIFGLDWKLTLINFYKNLDFEYLASFWNQLSKDEQCLCLYLYAFKRDYNESSKMTEAEWNDVFVSINKLSESK